MFNFHIYKKKKISTHAINLFKLIHKIALLRLSRLTTKARVQREKDHN